MKTKDELIEEIVLNFDYQKVQSVMEFLDWTWFDVESGVPSINKLILTSMRLLGGVHDEATKPGEYLLATGGFYAQATRYEDGEIVLSLQFVLANWENLCSAETA